MLGYERGPARLERLHRRHPQQRLSTRSQTRSIGGDLVEVQSWYDNEWGFSTRMVDLARVMAKKG